MRRSLSGQARRSGGSIWEPPAPPRTVFFNPDRAEAFRMLLAGTFTGLDSESRASLTDWLAGAAAGARAGAGRIDSVLDLSQRPWQVADVRTIIGVFERGKPAASWLIVRHRSLWTLVRCEDGGGCDTCSTLGELLALIDDAPIGDIPGG